MNTGFRTRLCGQRLAVLAALYCAGKVRPMRLTEIRKKCEPLIPISSSQLAMTLGRLVERGYIHKDDKGKRVYLYRLTDEGRHSFERACSALNTLAQRR